MSASVRRVLGAACVVVAMVGLAVVRMTSAAADEPAVLSACVNPGNGGLRLVPSAQSCHKNETFVQWNISGPAGPPGPPGEDGEDGVDGADGADATDGPPYVWACPGANLDFGNNNNAEIEVFNNSGATANVAVHFLAKNGDNLAGASIPCTNPVVTYPGQTGNATVAVAPFNTLIVPYQIGCGIRANDNGLLASVRVSADQPIVVGSQLANGLVNDGSCSLSPR
jgi:hypothetical protein